MIILVDVTWTRQYGSTSGSTWRGQGLAFDTATHTLVAYDQLINVATLDPSPVDTHTAAGAEIWYECGPAPGFDKTSWFYNGLGGTTTAITPNSPVCGWTAPPTCDLDTASVVQTARPAGATLDAFITGTSNGQLLYSLDGGPEQPSPRFTGVAPGQHAILIRDAGLAGCDRTVQVTVLAPAGPPTAPTGPSQGVDFVGQPLWYPLAGQPAGALVELELWAESAHGQENFTRALTMRKRADVQGDVAFRLDTLLWPLLSAFVPPAALNVATRLCTTNLVNYFVRTTTTPTDPLLPVTTGTSDVRTALRGALPAEWQGVDYFAYRQNLPFTHPPCLSWQPLGPGTRAAGQPKLITPTQPEWLFFLCPLANTTDDLRVRRAYAATLTGTPVVDYEPLVRPTTRGWAQRLLAIPLRATRTGFAYLSVRVETAAGVPVSQDAVYQFVDESPRTRYLLFTNSLGTVDTLRCSDKARLEITLEATTEKVERPARPGDVALTADRQVSDLTASRKLKLATGWLLPAELAWVQELVLSREVWHLEAGQLRPLDWAKRSLVPYSDEPTLRGLLLECDYAYSPIAYAPAYNA